jgi:hypothetical protein
MLKKYFRTNKKIPSSSQPRTSYVTDSVDWQKTTNNQSSRSEQASNMVDSNKGRNRLSFGSSKDERIDERQVGELKCKHIKKSADRPPSIQVQETVQNVTNRTSTPRQTPVSKVVDKQLESGSHIGEMSSVELLQPDIEKKCNTQISIPRRFNSTDDFSPGLNLDERREEQEFYNMSKRSPL